MQNDITMQTRQRQSRREHAPIRPIFPLLSVLVIMGTGLLTLCVQELTGSHAAGSNIVSQPTLPAASVERILMRVGSPMVGTGATIERMARITGIDDAFALAVWWAETNDGAAGVGINNRNPGSVRGSASYPGDSAGYTIYPSYSAAITEWFYLLKNSYTARGRSSVYAISGPYVGTAGSADWAAKVMNLMAGYRQEAPQPVIPSGPVPQRLLAVHTALSTQGTRIMQPESTQQPQRAMRAIESRNVSSQHQEPQESVWPNSETRETEVHSIRQTARQTQATTEQGHSAKGRHATKEISESETSGNEAIAILNDYQLPLAGTLASLIVIIFLITGRRSGKPTPLVHSRIIHDTEEFMLPHSLRVSSISKHNMLIEEIVIDSTSEANTEALSAFTGGLTLPVRRLTKPGEMSIAMEGLLSRYGDKTSEN
jgi:Mannosyl-glycoprotein endo-beta-N-acetylglucosaminidase.